MQFAAHGYVLKETLGAGSYGKVRRAFSNELKKEVAIKVILLKKAKPEYVEKFLPREIDVLKRLNHIHVVKFYQAIETNGRMFMVFELAGEGDLLDVIKTYKYLLEDQAGPWFTQILQGLDYIHEMGVAHRDMKSENILLDAQYNLKISDFGFARLFARKTSEEELSQTYCGSYAYAAPEVLRGVPYHAHCSGM